MNMTHENHVMNEYTYRGIDLTKSEYSVSFTVHISEDMMESFMALSGDENPLHVDVDFAKMEGFSGKVVYGMLIASFYSRLAGMYLPGKYSLLKRVDTHFHKPVYIGDSLIVSGFIKKKMEDGETVVLSAKIVNQNDEMVNTAKIEVGCME